MQNKTCCSYIFALVIAAVLCAIPSRALACAVQGSISPPAKPSAKADDKASKQMREYEKLRQKALKLYYDPKDSSFKKQADEAYRQKQREHSEYALAVNLSNSEAPHVTRTQDKLKVEAVFYDNLLVQEYVNRLGQSLVPKSSQHDYAFKVILTPYPEARALSTGTIYVSTGLLALVDNEAQLSYILSHEIAHIEKNHWFEDVMVEKVVREKKDRQSKTTKFILSVANIMADPFGGWFGVDEAIFELYAKHALPSLLKVATPKTLIAWDKAQEDEADKLALGYMLERSYDPHEVKGLYANLYGASGEEFRLRYGFTATNDRIVERVQSVNSEVALLNSALAKKSLNVGAVNLAANRKHSSELFARQNTAIKKLETEIAKATEPGKYFSTDQRVAPVITPAMGNEIGRKLTRGELIANGQEFTAMMAVVKRDNGIRAFQSDLFKMSRTNLAESLAIRNEDPLSHYYDGRIWLQTARNADEKRAGLEAVRRAVKLDTASQLPEARLHLALALVQHDRQGARQEVATLVKEYSRIYKSTHNGSLPPEVDTINEYFRDTTSTGNLRMLTASTKPESDALTQAKQPSSSAAGKKAETPPVSEKKPPQTKTKQKFIKKRAS